MFCRGRSNDNQSDEKYVIITPQLLDYNANANCKIKMQEKERKNSKLTS